MLLLSPHLYSGLQLNVELMLIKLPIHMCKKYVLKHSYSRML